MGRVGVYRPFGLGHEDIRETADASTTNPLIPIRTAVSIPSITIPRAIDDVGLVGQAVQ